MTWITLSLMRSKTIVNWIPIALLLAIVLVALFSWIGNIYELPVNDLFSGDGVRWWVMNFIPNISKSPFPYIVVGLISLSVLKESGLIRSFSRNASLKCRRAQSLSILVLIILCLIAAFMLFLPNAVLRNSFGSIGNSPFSHGSFGEISVAVLIVSNVYGLSSGNFINLDDTMKAHVYLLGRCKNYFITMVLVSELMGCLDYTGLLPQSSLWFDLVAWILYLVPLCLSLACGKK